MPKPRSVQDEPGDVELIIVTEIFHLLLHHSALRHDLI